ncbi:hypothetical protein [Terrabacter terrigena]|uniref:Terminase small subunit n=1 Tax=Terrabacter terrigena TaxID=574718 RepID=A0ABW3MXL1_9MICO
MIAEGDYLEILKALRLQAAKDVKTEKGPAKAAMLRQILQLSTEIAALEAERKAAAAEDAESDDGGDEDDEPFDAEAL